MEDIIITGNTHNVFVWLIGTVISVLYIVHKHISAPDQIHNGHWHIGPPLPFLYPVLVQLVLQVWQNWNMKRDWKLVKKKKTIAWECLTLHVALTTVTGWAWSHSEEVCRYEWSEVICSLSLSDWCKCKCCTNSYSYYCSKRPHVELLRKASAKDVCRFKTNML